MVTYKTHSLKLGLMFLFTPVLTERRENAVSLQPTAMGIKQTSTDPVGSTV